MSDLTSRLELYKSEADGSEDIDVDQDLNQNWDKVDEEIGGQPILTANLPGTPIPGALRFLTDTGELVIYVPVTGWRRVERTGIIARYRWTDTSDPANSSTRIPVVRIDDVPLIGSRSYKITVRTWMDSSVNDDVGIAEIRHTTDGSTPTVASTALPGTLNEVKCVGPAMPVCLNVMHHPSVNETLSILLAVARSSGTGNITLVASATDYVNEITIEDCGRSVASTGTTL